MKIQFIDHFGSDLKVVNCARTSFGKSKEVFDDKDAKLINFLARNNHIAPFHHCSVTVRIEVPIFVARQIAKSQIGFTISEESMRYIEAGDMDYFIPEIWRKGSKDIKQGSEGVTEHQTHAESIFIDACDFAFDTYKSLLELGVCKEQARAVLPVATNTRFIMTGTLSAWARLYGLRAEKTAQIETQFVALEIAKIIEPLFPHSWKALTAQGAST